MSARGSSGADLIELLSRKAPEYVDLVTARTDEEFEAAFCTLLERAVMRLEENRTHFAQLNEEGLSAVLAAALNMPGLSVSQETHSNGHVDLTIEADHCTPARRKLGEAKVYDGPEWHLKGLEQLLGRYTTGRGSRGLLLVYCRVTNIAEKVMSIRQRMDATLPLSQQGQTSDHTLKWSFRSEHAHSSGEVLGVDHVGCNLFSE